ncbi:hypothetical protein TRSC58_07305 [Trypanosoma rangeli SC58]|uniref:Uncharacterized protein n=1 Tax=Trypanosoma rangeli SC58 TaxID=429131 RepID=A0A061IRQ0_TRYRA|nr:hypothetical protein TRSC58_07305 [Trypanosoma rangeli SC58]
MARKQLFLPALFVCLFTCVVFVRLVYFPFFLVTYFFFLPLLLRCLCSPLLPLVFSFFFFLLLLIHFDVAVFLVVLVVACLFMLCVSVGRRRWWYGSRPLPPSPTHASACLLYPCALFSSPHRHGVSESRMYIYIYIYMRGRWGERDVTQAEAKGGVRVLVGNEATRQ